MTSSLSARLWRLLNIALILGGFLLPSFRSCEGIPTSTAQQVGDALQTSDQWLLAVLLVMPLLYALFSLLHIVNQPPRHWLWRAVPLTIVTLHVLNRFTSELQLGAEQILPGLWLTGVGWLSSLAQEIAEAWERRLMGSGRFSRTAADRGSPGP